ncbi:MAG: hypothetical protein RIQ61_1589 [Bacteroidota bacterium]|jgi:hypothetical protein
MSFKRILNHENSFIINVMLLHSFFENTIWLLPHYRDFRKIIALDYEILFPLFIICIIFIKKYTNLLALLVFGISIVSLLLLNKSTQIPIAELYKMGLSFVACTTVLLIVLKNTKRLSFQVFMLLLIAGILLIDMFFNAVFSAYFSFNMNAWMIFINSYKVYLSITDFIFIYYYGRQLFKH